MPVDPEHAPGSSPSGGSCHVAVMPEEIVHWIGEIAPRVIIDGTFGGGGHARRLLECLPQQPASDDRPVCLIGLDRDPAVSRRAENETSDPRLHVFIASYEQTPKALAQFDLSSADAMLLDLGLSSDQLSDSQRGFSFTRDGPLDLRFDPESGMPAHAWLAGKKEREIADAIYAYGEERFSRRIARAVAERQRKRQPVKTVGDLVEICRRCVPRSRHHDIHPATRTFQALRIVVNDELGALERTLKAAPEWLNPGGRLAVISFHSLEDRLVKNAFRDDDRWRVLTKKPLRPSEEEVAANPRSRSAKLRVAERA